MFILILCATVLYSVLSFALSLRGRPSGSILIEQGYADINSPKSVMKTAFSDGLLTNENGWLEILESRNITSHVYDEKPPKQYLKALKTCIPRSFPSL